jgi:hypothetical protein
MRMSYAFMTSVYRPQNAVLMPAFVFTLTFVMALGGCPGSDSTGILDLTGSPSVNVNLGDDDLQPVLSDLPDVVVGTMQDQQFGFKLTAPEGSNSQLAIRSMPDRGTISVLDDQAGELELIYVPAPGFVGTTSLQYALAEPSGSSDFGTVTIHVYPEILFQAARAIDGSGLTLELEAFTVNGSPLPDGVYTWSFNQERLTKLNMQDGSFRHTLAKAGTYRIALMVTLLGMTTELNCLDADSGLDFASLTLIGNDDDPNDLPGDVDYELICEAGDENRLTDDPALDCDGNGVKDVCDLLDDPARDADGNGVLDICEADCNGNGFPDLSDISLGSELDCNGNLIPDSCELADGSASDCNGNGIPDSCETDLHDCNGNGIPDSCDISDGTSSDSNVDGIPDECFEDCDNNGIHDPLELQAGSAADANGNGVIDSCDIADGTSQDVNGNGIPDETEPDCDHDSIPDAWAIGQGDVADCDHNGVPDTCQPDSDSDGVIDACDNCPNDANKTEPGDCGCGVADTDSDGDGVPDCNDNCPSIANADQADCNGDGIGDVCEADCNHNDVPDGCDITDGTSQDCNSNGIPDECDIVAGSELDCNSNGVPDSCDIAAGTSQDCNSNDIPDECEIADGDVPDCNNNGVPDSCDISSGTSADCNANGVPDECDIALGDSADSNSDGIPDECASIYYVDDDGPDQPGYNPSDPLGTYFNPFDEIQDAVDLAGPGDTVMIAPGLYREHVKIDKSGAPGAPIELRGRDWYAGAAHDRALTTIISGDRDGGSPDSRAVEVLQSGTRLDHFVFRGLILEDTSTSGVNLRIVHGGNVLIEDCIARNSGNLGIAFTGYLGGENITIRRCVIHDNGRMGVGIGGKDNGDLPFTNVLIEDCDSFGNGWNEKEDAEGFWAASNRSSDYEDRITFVTYRRCIAHNNWSSSFVALDIYDTMIEDCIGWGTTRDGDADGRNFVMGLHHEGGRSIVRRSVGFDCPKHGFTIENHSDVRFYNNMAFDNGFTRPGENEATLMAGLRISGENAWLRNNVTFDNPYDYDGNPDSTAPDIRLGGSAINLDSDYNLVGDGSGTEGSHSLTGSPQIVSKSTARTLADIYAAMNEHDSVNWATREQFLAAFADALRPAAGSQLIDAGAFVMHLAGDVTNSAVVSVDKDPGEYFRVGDAVQIDDGDGVAATKIEATITSMTSNSITLDQAVTASNGSGLHIPYEGNAPDIGPYEYIP